MSLFGKKDELQIAMDLLKGPGLNHAAFTRAMLDLEKIDNGDKNKTREAFASVIDLVKEEFGDDIYKDGHDHFLKEADVPAMKTKIAELSARVKALELENGQLRAEIDGAVDDSDEPKTWRYNTKTGKAAIFTMSKAAQLDDDWKDHPDK